MESIFSTMTMTVTMSYNVISIIIQFLSCHVIQLLMTFNSSSGRRLTKRHSDRDRRIQDPCRRSFEKFTVGLLARLSSEPNRSEFRGQISSFFWKENSE